MVEGRGRRWRRREREIEGQIRLTEESWEALCLFDRELRDEGGNGRAGRLACAIEDTCRS